MSGREVISYERTVVPDGQVVQYQEQQRTGHLNPQAKSQLAVLEQSRAIGAARDSNGLVSAEDYVTADARCNGALCKGYQVPAGMRFDPQELFEALDIAHKVGIPGNYVFAYLAEMGRRLK